MRISEDRVLPLRLASVTALLANSALRPAAQSRRSSAKAFALAAALSISAPLLPACQPDTAPASTTSTGAAGVDTNGAEAVVTIADAASQPDGTDVTVEGFLVEDSGTVVLAELLAESFPPQAGGATIPVDGLDLSGFELEAQGPVRWSNGVVTVHGTVEAGRLKSATVEAD